MCFLLLFRFCFFGVFQLAHGHQIQCIQYITHFTPLREMFSVDFSIHTVHCNLMSCFFFSLCILYNDKRKDIRFFSFIWINLLVTLNTELFYGTNELASLDLDRYYDLHDFLNRKKCSRSNDLVRFLLMACARSTINWRPIAQFYFSFTSFMDSTNFLHTNHFV